MNFNFSIYLIVAILLLTTGCSNKKYFEPEEVSSKIKTISELGSKIEYVTRAGATLEDGRFISEDGVVEFESHEEFRYLNSNENYIMSALACGRFILYDSSDRAVVLDRIFDREIVAANSDKNLLVTLSSENKIYIVDIENDEIIFTQQENLTYAHTSKIANPYILNDLILIPTLDGKIVIYDKEKNNIFRNIVVNNEKYFNNIIFFDVLNDRMVAATQKRVISLSPSVINTFDADVRDVIFVRDRIYILTKDGTILLMDIDLNEIARKKFPFAHLLGAMHKENIYLVEKNGYIISLDIDLEYDSVFEFVEKIDDYHYINKDSFFYKDSYFRLK